MPVPIKTQLLGVNELAETIRGLEPKYFRPAARAGVSDASTEVLKEARNRVPDRTGSLKKALGKRVVALKSGAGYTGVVGARKDPSAKRVARIKAEIAAGKKRRLPRTGRFRKEVALNGRTVLVDPVKYLHLVEYGRRSVRLKTKRVLADGAVVYGTEVRAVPATGFLRASWEAKKAASEAAIRRRVKEARAKAVAAKGR